MLVKVRSNTWNTFSSEIEIVILKDAAQVRRSASFVIRLVLMARPIPTLCPFA